jgi:carbon storage regulator
MLVLSRRPGESININENIVVTIIEIRGDKVRLGIDAPKDIKVHRQEVAEAIAAKLTEESNPATDSLPTQ